MELCNMVVTAVGKMALCKEPIRGNGGIILQGLQLRLDSIKGHISVWELSELRDSEKYFKVMLCNNTTEQEHFQAVQSLFLSLQTLAANGAVTSFKSAPHLCKIQVLAISLLCCYCESVVGCSDRRAAVFKTLKTYKSFNLEVPPNKECLHYLEIVSGHFDVVNEMLFLLSIFMLRDSSAREFFPDFVAVATHLKNLFCDGDDVLPKLIKFRSSCPGIVVPPMHRTDIIEAAVSLIVRYYDPTFCLHSDLYCS